MVGLSPPQRLYRSGDADSLHKYTPIPDHPDFARARLNAMYLSDVSRAAWCVPASVTFLGLELILLVIFIVMFKS